MKRDLRMFLLFMCLLLAVPSVGAAQPKPRTVAPGGAAATAPGSGQGQTGQSPAAQPSAPFSNPVQVQAPAPGTPAAQPSPPAPSPQPQVQHSPTGQPPAPPPSPARPFAGQPAAAGRGKAQGPGQGFVFKFDNADLYEVIRTLAEVLRISYVIDPKVKGTVNIQTTGPIAQEDIFPIFLTILRMNGATVVKKENLYEIVPFGEGKKLPFSIDELKQSASDRFAIEVIKPNFIPISELEKVVKPFLSDEKELIPFPQNNLLIVSDLSANIRKIREIINLFDIDIFTNMTIRIYPVVNSDVKDMATELERIFSSFGIPTKDAKGGGITFLPITRLPALLVVSSIPGVLDKVENWIKELDKGPADESKPLVFVYYVQNSKAKDLAEVLKQVYAKGSKEVKKTEEPKKEPTTPSRTTTTTRTTRTTEQQKPGSEAPKPSTPSSTGEGIGAAEGEINIVVDETSNALVVRALQRDYKAVMETVKKLDIYPKQVLIEAFLAEITLDNNVKFGVEWGQFLYDKGNYSHTFTVGATPAATIPDYAAGGIRYSVVDLAGRVNAAISAAAGDSRLNVISSPHIIASNNKEAKIQIGQEQPILTTTYRPDYSTSSTTTTSSNYLEGNIEYKDIGIIMTVTPRISDGGLITLEIQVEKSDVGKTNLGSLADVPFFPKKTAKTTLSVQEGQTVVIGGLIEDTKNTTKSGVPFLSRIPILGGLFGTQSYEKKKTETIMLLTPHIITDQNQSRAVTEEFRTKVDTLLREIERSGKGRK
jgi:general secretion pathway protein D